jgi:lactate permease
VYRQVLDPFAHSLAWSALLATLPVAALFALLGLARTQAWKASLGALAVAALVAAVVYPMPVGQVALAAGQGAAFGLFPLAWTFVTAIWIYQMTVETGHFNLLSGSFARVSGDQRVQAIVIAFCFGALLEGLAGQGTPVAITTVMLMAVGFTPIKSASIALVANTVPAAFGPLGLPITTLAKVTGLPSSQLGAMAGRQVPIIALFVPLLLVAVADGRRGLREAWWPALAAGMTFAVTQFVVANYVAMSLADIGAAMLSACVVAMVAKTRPAASFRLVPAMAGGSVDEPDPMLRRRLELRDTRVEVLRAYSPYLIIVAIFVLSQWSVVGNLLNGPTKSFGWPGLHVFSPSGKASTLTIFKFNYLATTGTLLLAAGLVTMAVLRIAPRAALAAYWRVLIRLRTAIVAVAGLLALSFVMNTSGQTATLGTWMASAGHSFALLSPIVGWLGVSLTGSDTSSNSLFGALQVTAAGKAGLSTTLLAAANASGGVVGKMISLQNLTIAAGAVGLEGGEGLLFRRMLPWSLVLLTGMCLIVGLQSTSVLSWMVP